MPTSGWQQFKVLAWKNYLLKRRHWFVLFLELAIPVVILGAMSGLRTIVVPVDKDTIIPSQASYVQTLGEVYNDIPQCDSENILWSCVGDSCADDDGGNTAGCRRRMIAVAPKDASDSSDVEAAEEFFAWANQTYYEEYNDQFFQYFSSESVFLDFIESSTYALDLDENIISAAVIFRGGYPSWDYTLRFNQTYITLEGSGGIAPQTSQKANDLTVRYSGDSSSTALQPYLIIYNRMGTLVLGDVVNTYIATTTCRETGKCDNADTVTVQTRGTVEFPSPEVIVNGFWGLIGPIFALFMIIALIYPFFNIIRALVTEKETKMREGMYMMAMRSDALYGSWLLHFVLLLIPLSLLLTLVGTTLFVNSDAGFIFFYFFLFFMASIAYCFFIATIFSRSLTAATIGSLIYFAGYFIFIGIASGGSAPSRGQILAACLHPAAAFTFGTLAFTEYEDVNIGITSETWNTSEEYPVTFEDTLVMQIVDIIWLSALSWYLSHIWPSEFGTRKPFYFCCTPRYWMDWFKSCCCFCMSVRKSLSYEMVEQAVAIDESCPVEPVTESLHAQVAQKQCVDIRGLVKTFDTKTGTKVAVDELNLTMYQGQITALLGHNGAGKTTTIAMLTGLIAPDGGSASIKGADIRYEMDEIRTNLGVCPQHDILFPDLTVEEHLIMFAAFKGMSKEELRPEVEKMIVAVGLTEKRQTFSKQLSGGQKRKLSVAIAFIGGSKVVFLDEPTSGMDPYSRRFTWNLIKNHREGRVIVLTTHFMDEADLLGDRIAIMGDGRLRCCGSSLFLKRMFGVGYNMTMEKCNATNFDSPKMASTVVARIPEATMLTDVGTEMTFQLPFSASEKFPSLFEYLDENLSKLGLQSYGVSVTTLEEVFIKVAEGTSTHSRAQAGRLSDKGREEEEEEKATEKFQIASNTDKVGVDGEAVSADVEAQRKDVTFFDKVPDENSLEYFHIHVKATVGKRAKYFMRDTRSIIFQYVIPVAFVLIGMIIIQINTYITPQPNKTLTVRMYNGDINTNYYPLPYSSNGTFCYTFSGGNTPTCDVVAQTQTDLMEGFASYTNYPIQTDVDANSISEMSQYIFDTRDDFKASQESTYSFTDAGNFTSPANSSVTYFLHANYSAVFGGPLTQAILSDAIVSKLDAAADVTVRLHPLPLSNKEAEILESYNTDLVVTFVMIAVAFMCASFVMFVVREKETKAKHQQMVSGMSVGAFWIGNWLWDIISYQPTAWTFILLISAFPKTALLSGTSTPAFGCMVGLFLLFGPAVSGFCYILSYMFRSPSMAQIVVIFALLMLGFVLGIVGIVLRAIDSTTDDWLNYIRYFFCLIPTYALADGLHNMALIDQWSFSELSGGLTYSVTDLRITGVPLIFLAMESVVYIGLVILYEYLSTIPSVLKSLSSTGDMPVDETLRDEDVLAEEERVRSGQADDSSVILVKDLKKKYGTGKYAVRGVSLGIPNGECFGLLGINGAGKTTTLSILSGEFPPSSGEASLAGLNLLTEVHKCRRKIGFCPQFDALYELLSAREHLELYARIKGIAESDIQRVVAGKIAEMGLTEYADRAAGTYSGGNKRKLSVAIAMIGEPSIVFLDEPSTGMDPVARRFMWEVISDIVTKREKCSLILTTHSMEECEALCTRIGIMVGGVVRCLGSSQRLRSHYGRGFQIEIGIAVPSREQLLETMNWIAGTLGMETTFGDTDDDAEISEEQMYAAFAARGKDAWRERISDTGSGAELLVSLTMNPMQPVVHVKQVASWIMLETAYDGITEFLTAQFGSFQLRERQASKLRVEVDAYEGPAGAQTKRKLSTMFAAVEAQKAALMIDDYSIAQTSLEQIFNSFAAQQEEEKGHAQGIQSQRSRQSQ